MAYIYYLHEFGCNLWLYICMSMAPATRGFSSAGHRMCALFIYLIDVIVPFLIETFNGFAEAGVMRAPGAGACATALVCAGVPRWACTAGARAPPNPADYAASGAPHHPRPVFPHVDAINHRFAIWSVS